MSDSFFWKERRFTWRSSTTPPMFSTEEVPVAAFSGRVVPEGKAWLAHLFINGGSTKGRGATPEAALDIALEWWVESINAVVRAGPTTEKPSPPLPPEEGRE